MSDAKGGEGYISYCEDKVKGHKIITSIYCEKWQADFVPVFKLKRLKK